VQWVASSFDKYYCNIGGTNSFSQICPNCQFLAKLSILALVCRDLAYVLAHVQVQATNRRSRSTCAASEPGKDTRMAETTVSATVTTQDMGAKVGVLVSAPPD
jgi:hypothetical protein